ncbi:MAG TPA: carbohydrate kinase [Desulfobulbus sp.]|nr:carbohydrate kinase [Desulfobulbus sp.]HHD63294.1 carbohydrate kinase [Desulfobulbaceae bacterium]
MITPIVSFGEIVWDQFENGRTLGGAPLNVAYHLHAAGWPARIVSRIGRDALGRETLNVVTGLGLPVTTIQQDPDLPTGLVLVSLGRDGEPNFEIAAPAAWDNIQDGPVLAQMGETPFHLVFGTLAQRSEISRRSLYRLLKQATLKFYDVNLRPPHTTPELVHNSLIAADVVKANHDELIFLADRFLKEKTGSARETGHALLNHFNLALLAVTDGARGASLITKDGYATHGGYKVKVVDPVGSGDAFFAALIGGYLEKLPLDECLRRANYQGAWVAGRQGATPSYPDVSVE